ncbi:aldo/keto reductase [Micromonospora sp. DT43]|uniref:aldo/keto reductase n=1 Tax=Micromonospora sp. DT43 TaxID=3393440 RepID=UPI003CF2D745
MRTRRIGPLTVSAVGVGTSAFTKQCDEAGAAAVVAAALDAGITYYDTADSYGAGRAGRAEEVLGRALKGVRDEVVISSKFGTEFAGQPASASAGRARAAIDGTLRRLGTDHVDVYLQHVPDPAVPIAETLGALREIAGQGKARVVGCCNLSGPQLREALAAGAGCVQDRYNVLDRGAEEEILPACTEGGVSFVCYAPLADGLLTGQYTGGRVPAGSRAAGLAPHRSARLLQPDRVDRSAAFARWCRGAGLPPVTAALAWLLHRPGVAAVIPGAHRPDQIRDLAEAASLPWADSWMTEIDNCLQGAAVA